MIETEEEIKSEFLNGIKSWIEKGRIEDLKYIAGGLVIYTGAFRESTDKIALDVIKRGVIEAAEKCRCSPKEAVRRLFESGDGQIFMGRLYNNDLNLLQEYDMK